MKDLINWKQVSIALSGNDNSIRKNQIPKKYQLKINRLLKFIDFWLQSENNPNCNSYNLDEVIKKAKPNMDKIKDVDKHIHNII